LTSIFTIILLKNNKPRSHVSKTAIQFIASTDHHLRITGHLPPKMAEPIVRQVNALDQFWQT
jgi:hypothetical protein